MEDDRWPKVNPDRMLVWLRPDTSDVVNNKIGSAFRNVKSFPLKRMMIQFWRPVKTPAGCKVLSCSDNPCAYTGLNNRLGRYRSRSCMYYYVIDDCSQVVDDDPMTITGAPPSTAFLNHFPEVVMDLRVHRGTPLVDLALECELTCFVMVPVFDQTSCLGVIEVSMRFPGDLIVIFNELNRELKRVGLCTNPPRPPPLPCKVITGLSASEVEKALQMTCQLHGVTLAQLWICYESYHCNMKRTILGKVKSVGDQLSLVKQFYDNLHVLPLKKGEGGLIGRTLETHQPHICRNIYKLSDNKGVYALLSASIKCTCCLICLRSPHTGEVDYVLEFFWPQSRNHLSLMKDLLLALKEYLPSYKHASGAQLGDEVLVIDVHNSYSGSGSGSGSTPIKIFEGNEKTIDLFEDQSELNHYHLTNPESEDYDEEDDLVILAFYKVDYKLFYLPSSATFENVLEKIKQVYELLNPAGSYKMEYQVVPGEWYSLTDDTCLKSCISSYRTSNNNNHIKLGVLDVEE